MKWTNYHSHTNYSDGTSCPEEYIIKAIESGIVAYGFSCHAPVEFPCTWTIDKQSLHKYFDDILLLKEKYSSKIRICKSLEIDYFPGNPLSNPENYQKYDLDYTIGSVHFVDNLKSGEAWNIDTSKRIFDDGMIEIFHGNGRDAVTRFYDLTMEMVRVMNPTIIGHIDKIKMFNKNNQYFSDSDDWYLDKVEDVLQLVAKNKNIIEVNTRGIYRGKTHDHYPSDAILKRCLELEIPVTINSDCHKPQEVASGFIDATKLLLNIGFKKVRVLLDRTWEDVALSEKGLLI
jgi:histidinol-phosphatase (PHP family)